MSVLDELHHQLALAQRDFTCADMIDNTARRETEMAYHRGRVDGLKRRIAELESDPVNLAGLGPVPIEPREG